jgi:hypothetical protein
MTPLMQDLIQYLETSMGLRVKLVQTRPSPPLPHFLALLYETAPLEINGTPWLGVMLRDGAELTPAVFEKHVRQLPWGEAEGYVLIAKALPGYVRRRLIERRIPFVIPKHQLYLPQLGMELRPRQPNPDKFSAPIEKISPATQVIVLLALTRIMPAGSLSPLDAARLTGYTPMTMTRAWDELELLGVGIQTREGKQRLLRLPEDHRALWNQVRPFMRSPVQQTVRLFQHDLPPLALKADASALAEGTMLSPPKQPVYAVSRDDWLPMKATRVPEAPPDEPGSCLVQIWRYPPALCARNGIVDPFSLYLSLKDDPDERVQMALDNLMEQYAW